MVFSGPMAIRFWAILHETRCRRWMPWTRRRKVWLLMTLLRWCDAMVRPLHLDTVFVTSGQCCGAISSTYDYKNTVRGQGHVSKKSYLPWAGRQQTFLTSTPKEFPISVFLWPKHPVRTATARPWVSKNTQNLKKNKVRYDTIQVRTTCQCPHRGGQPKGHTERSTSARGPNTRDRNWWLTPKRLTKHWDCSVCRHPDVGRWLGCNWRPRGDSWWYW